MTAKRHLNGVFAGIRMMAQHGMLLGSFVIFQGIRTSTAKEPYIFVIFQGGGGGGGVRTPCPPPPLWIRTCMKIVQESRKDSEEPAHYCMCI